MLPRSPASSPPRERVWRWRIQAYGLLLVAAYAFILAFQLKTGSWILRETGRPFLMDFTPMWLAGRDALNGHAAAAYDFKEFAAAQAAFVGKNPFYYPWPYPPVYFFPAALVAMLPYAWAYVLWEAATLLALLAVGYRIVRERAAIVAILASPLVMFNAMAGQNGFLTAALFGAAFLLLERRPFVAGGLFACLTYKPQLAFVLPLVLAVSGRWRALLGAAAAAALLAALSLIAFGAAAWQAFPAALSQRAASAFAAEARSGVIQSLYELLHFFGMGTGAVWSLQISAAVAVVGLTCALWRSEASAKLKAAAATTASLIATPYLFAYDMIVGVIAAAFLVADQIERGSSRGERLAVFALFCGQFAAVAWGRLPLGALLNLALFALILWRAWRKPGSAIAERGPAGNAVEASAEKP